MFPEPYTSGGAGALNFYGMAVVNSNLYTGLYITNGKQNGVLLNKFYSIYPTIFVKNMTAGSNDTLYAYSNDSTTIYLATISSNSPTEISFNPFTNDSSFTNLGPGVYYNGYIYLPSSTCNTF